MSTDDKRLITWQDGTMHPRPWNHWWCRVTLNHRWHPLSLTVKVCTRCGQRSGGFLPGGPR